MNCNLRLVRTTRPLFSIQMINSDCVLIPDSIKPIYSAMASDKIGTADSQPVKSSPLMVIAAFSS